MERVQYSSVLSVLSRFLSSEGEVEEALCVYSVKICESVP